jgi:hypothetical protein
MVEKAPETSPRGTDRIRRRASQQAHAARAQTEVAELTSRDTPEKRAAIEAGKVQVARFGVSPGGIRKVRQAANKAAAEVEQGLLPELRLTNPTLVPGAQVSLLHANRRAKVDDVSEQDFVREAGKAAGLAVRETLRGRPLRDKHNRSRHIALHNAKVDAAQRAAAAAQK